MLVGDDSVIIRIENGKRVLYKLDECNKVISRVEESENVEFVVQKDERIALNPNPYYQNSEAVYKIKDLLRLSADSNNCNENYIEDNANK